MSFLSKWKERRDKDKWLINEFPKLTIVWTILSFGQF